MKFFFATILLLGAAGALAAEKPSDDKAKAAPVKPSVKVSVKPNFNNPRDTTYPACDKHTGYNSPHERTTSFPVKYIPDNNNPDAGACGGVYGATPGICIKPGFVHSGFANHCGKKVEVSRNGVTIQATVVDVCGADAGSKMSCDDLFLTENAFIKLGGDTKVGQLSGPVTWKFVDLN